MTLHITVDRSIFDGINTNEHSHIIVSVYIEDIDINA